MQRHDSGPHAEDGLGESDADRLILVSASPHNAETRLAAHGEVVTPNAAFFIRTHFPPPPIDRETWRLVVDGEVSRPSTLTYAELLALPARTLLVTLECAGNGRAALRPQPDGEPWGFGAASTAVWTGVPLQTVLTTAGLAPAVSDIVIEGADGGYLADVGRTLSYARSLARDHALHPDTLLAYAMNGAEIPVAHGFPVRLIVPGWYGMAAVKWVTRVTAQSHPFAGFYQADRYVLERADGDQPTSTPLTTMRVRSLIAEPVEGAFVPRGEHVVRGFAWSGAGPIARVEVSVDGGAAWAAADLTSEPERYAWRRWEYRWSAKALGAATLMSRARDTAGNQQPAEPEWNRLGYANNAVQAVHVYVT